MTKPEVFEANADLVELTMKALTEAVPGVGFIVLMIEEKDVTVSGNVPREQIRVLLQQAFENLFPAPRGDA